MPCSASSSSVDCPRQARQKLMEEEEEEEEEYSCRCRETIDPWTPLNPDDHFIFLLKQSNSTRANIQRAANTAGLDLEDKAFDVENPTRAKTATQKGKMDAETNKNPLLDQKDNREDKLEYMSNFAFLLLILAFGVLYLLGSAKLGRNGNNTSLVICLHAWTAVMMLLLFIGSHIQFPAGVLKIMRLVMSGVIFISALVIFILAHCAL